MKHYFVRLLSGIFTLVFTCSLMSNSFADADDQSGVITDIASDLETISVRLDDENTVESYTIHDDTEITFRDGSGGVEDLSVGDRVILNFAEDASTSTRRANRLTQGRAADDISATVVGVDTDDNLLTVRFSDNNEVESFAILPETDIWIRNAPGSATRSRAAELEDIRVGDRVLLDIATVAAARNEGEPRTARWVTYDYEAPEVDTRVAANTNNRQDTQFLPDTASIVPFIGFFGMLMLGFAGVLRLLRKA